MSLSLFCSSESTLPLLHLAKEAAIYNVVELNLQRTNYLIREESLEV